jgi:hypothetical protein
MSVCQCPHCGSPHQLRVTGSGRVAKKQQCQACGGFLSSAWNFAKKVASNPMVQTLAKAAAPHAMKALQKHAPGLANVANRAVGVAQRVAANPMVQRIASNPTVQRLAQAAAPRAVQALQRHAPGLVSAVERVAAQPLAQRGLAELRSRVGMGRKKGNKAYESESDEEKEGGRKRRKRKGGISLGALMPFAGQAIGAIPGAADALGPFGALLGIPQQAPPPPPPPRASFQGIQGFQAPGMMARPSVMGRGRKSRPPTKHAMAVKEVMKMMGMGLPQASRYVKEKGLAK